MYVYYKSAPRRQTNYKVNFKQDELFDLLSYFLSPQVATNLSSGYRLITYLYVKLTDKLKRQKRGVGTLL